MDTVWITAAGSLGGVIVGGLLTQVGNWRTLRLQGNLAVAAERRERSMTSAAVAIEAASKLLLLDDAPYEPNDRASFAGREPSQQAPTDAVVDAWESRKSELVLVLETAALDLPADIRHELKSAVQVLRTGSTAQTGRLESQQRKAACEFALDCLGSFRRGEKLPGEQDYFKTAREATELEIEIWELDARTRREYALQLRQARKAANPSGTQSSTSSEST